MIALVVIAYVALLALSIWLILIRPVRPWTEKLGSLLQIVGLYTFGFGVITQANIFPADLTSDLSSPDLFKFLSGNATALALATAAMSMALDPEKTSFGALAFLQLFGTLGLGVFGIAFVIFYAVIIAPLSYVAYVVVSLPVSAVATAATDITFALGDDTVSLRQIAIDHPVLLKNFLISFSSLALKMSLDLATSFRRTSRGGADASPAGGQGWLSRHRRLANIVLIGSQIVLGLILFVMVVGALILPSTVVDEADAPAATGEIVGAEIAMALAIWALTASVVRLRRRWRMVTARTPAGEPAIL